MLSLVLFLVAALAPQTDDAVRDTHASSPGARRPSEVVIRGGRWFDVERGRLVENSGIVVRARRFAEIGADLEARDLGAAHVIELEEDEVLLPGLIDLHAHYGMDFYGEGRVDERQWNPILFLANGVTTTFPAGEVNPDEMRDLRIQLDRGARIGPRLFNSGPYFGRWRRGWDPAMAVAALEAEVDLWAERGVKGFKAKGIGPEHLRALIDRAHGHGLTVTGHLDSGYRNSVNPRDAILMGIDRVEHFLGGDAMPADRSAYESLVSIEPETDEFRAIARLFIDSRVFFDATLTAYGYYGAREADVYEDFADESSFFTPYVRQLVAGRPVRQVHERFERIYRVKRVTIKAFYDAGGGPWITLGTDHPSTGEFLAAFSVHRELHAFVLAGIPPADALRFGTINAARALRAGDSLGSIAIGKLADAFVVKGNPLEDVRNTRNVRLVIRGGEVYDAPSLLGLARGKVGPAGPDEADAWKPRRR